MLSTEALCLQLGNKRLCDQLSINFEPGQFWCLLGPNGSGKTTLLHALAGLHKPQSGQVSLNGIALNKLQARTKAQQLGILFQQEEQTALTTVYDALLSARHPYQTYWQTERAADKTIIDNILAQLDLIELKHHYLSSLSGGERQRVAIGMLLTQETDVLLLDEPTNHLDLKHQFNVLNLLRNLASQHNKLIIASLHDVNLAEEFCDHACLLYPDGKITNGKRRDIFDANSLGLLYNLGMKKMKSGAQSWWRCSPD